MYGSVVTYTYDALYRVQTLTDGNGHATHYYYTKAGYLDSMTYPGYRGPTYTFLVLMKHD